MNKQKTCLIFLKQRPDPISHLLKIFPTYATNCGIKFKCLILEGKASEISPLSSSTTTPPTLGTSCAYWDFCLFACLLFSRLPESPFSGHCKPHILGGGTVPSAQLILGGAANPSSRHTTQVGRIKSFPGINIVPEGRSLFPLRPVSAVVGQHKPGAVCDQPLPHEELLFLPGGKEAK